MPDSKVTNEHYNWPEYVIKVMAGSGEEALKVVLAAVTLANQLFLFKKTAS